MLQLALKTLHFAGELTGTALADRLGVPFSVIEPALDLLKAMHHCEIVGGALVGGASFRYRITDAGRVSAALFLDQNGYVGIAPVPIGQYQEYMRRYPRRHAAHGDARSGPRGILRAGAVRPRARSARTGHQRAAIALHLRPARQRQEPDDAAHS